MPVSQRRGGKRTPTGLYNAWHGDGLPTIAITQSGSSGNYSYAVTGSYSQAANCPIFDITWGDAARFCNWLQNGQPTGPEGPGTTETGAYTLNGDTTNLMAITRNAGATYFLPSENEWYKAAYYKGGEDQCRLLVIPHAEQHPADQHAPGHGQPRELLRLLGNGKWRLHRSNELPDPGGGVCRFSWRLRHV